MAVLYPSQEWCEAWKNAVNASRVVEETGKGWGVGFNGNFLFEITPGGGLDRTTYLYFVVGTGGKCLDGRLIADPEEAELGFLASGPYPKFKEIVKGEKDFVEVVLRGDLKLKGDMAKIMRNARYIRAVADTLSTFKSEYLGE